MNTDFSVAPEIAQLAGPLVPAQHAVAAPRTDGRVAGDLADLAASPERWWDLVRFDSGGPARIPLPDVPGSWLLVLPPGMTADCDCHQATALAGDAVELSASGAGSARPLRPGRVRVHGAPAAHRLRAVGLGYSVTLHARASRPSLPGAAGSAQWSTHKSSSGVTRNLWDCRQNMDRLSHEPRSSLRRGFQRRQSMP